MTAETTAATGAADTSATDTATTTAAATDATQSTDAQGNTAETETSTTAETSTQEAETEGAPDTYAEFAMPEGMTADTAALEVFTPTFKEIGLTQAQAQKLVDVYAGLVAKQGEGAAEQAEQWYQHRRAQEIAQANEEGIAAIKADKDLGGANFDKVKARIDGLLGAVGTPELRQKFDKLGLGNDPDLVRLLNAAIDYTPQDTGERPAGGGGAGPSQGDRMYRYAERPAKRQS